MPLDDDRLEEQGLVWEIDPDAEPRPAVSPPEMATTDPSEQRDGTQPRVRAERAGSDGERHGAAAKRPRDGRDGVPEGREQEPDPWAVDRRRRGRDRSDDAETLQGIDGKARHQSRTVVRAAATACCDAVSIRLRNRR